MTTSPRCLVALMALSLLFVGEPRGVSQATCWEDTPPGYCGENTSTSVECAPDVPCEILHITSGLLRNAVDSGDPDVGLQDKITVTCIVTTIERQCVRDAQGNWSCQEVSNTTDTFYGSRASGPACPRPKQVEEQEPIDP